MLLTENINRLQASFFIDLLIQLKIDTFFTCPGLRNAPLLSALDAHSKAKTIPGVDERSHSFRALGWIKANHRPAVLICTSGTACAHFLPAVIEAAKESLPLIVLSADRPNELILANDNQTCDQTQILSPFAKTLSHLEPPNSEHHPDRLMLFAKSLSEYLCRYSTPVHINWPFRDPLDHTKQNLSQKTVERYQESLQSFNKKEAQISFRAISDIPKVFSHFKKPLFIFGHLGHMDLNINFKGRVSDILSQTHGHFYADISSQLKTQITAQLGGLPTLDHPEIFDCLRDSPPDGIIHYGSRVTSKHFYRFLKENKDIPYLHLTPPKMLGSNPAFHNASFCQMEFEPFLSFMAETYTSSAPKRWLNITALLKSKRNYIENAPLSYPVITKAFLDLLPDNSKLFIGNSTMIRSFDSYLHPCQSKMLEIYTQRGVSGIEGHIATSEGLSLNSSNTSTFCFLGDLSTLHDIGSLFTLNKNCQLKIIIANNFGGGIFDLLPIGESKWGKPLIQTPHHYQFKKIAQAMNFNYTAVETTQELNKVISEFINISGSSILECQFDQEQNKSVYQQLRTIRI